ncbi:hypothetical protein PLICRDRAFT_177011 [Plicaturopsis crispa FD-325 SS-3]|nr:hypothetical protein PLICRDRAFT_177011 [Plicaturopsis crispa FD-325 SS-3]
MLSSPYSALFTSGLLSECLSPAPELEDLGPRRGSLPTDASSSSPCPGDVLPLPTINEAAAKLHSPTDESAAFYFTLQPRRGSAEFRSFLSLDLAESQSLRSASVRRKGSKRTTASSRNINLGKSERPRTRLESLRTRLPSPKPAPSATLPSLPSPSPSPAPSSTSKSKLAPAPTPKSKLTPSPAPSPALASFTFPPRTPAPISSSTRAPKHISVATTATTASSSVTSTYKHGRYEDALARLEGRVASASTSNGGKTSTSKTGVVRKPTSTSNFMNMSDDSDSDDSDSDVDVDDVCPPIMDPSTGNHNASPSTPSSGNGLTPPSRRNRSNTESWVPFASFIDFREDESWNWRAFIEVGGAV